MALIEGGPFHCYKDGFETTEINEWNEHCSKQEGDSTHILDYGSTFCKSCGELFEFKDLPFQKLDPTGSKNISMKCEDCAAKEEGKVVKAKTKTTAAATMKAGSGSGGAKTR